MCIGIKTLAELQSLNILRQFMCNAEDIESEVIDTKPALIVSHFKLLRKGFANTEFRFYSEPSETEWWLRKSEVNIEFAGWFHKKSRKILNFDQAMENEEITASEFL